MRAPAVGALRHRLVLESLQSVPDGAGGFEPDWTTVAVLYGAIDTLSRTRAVENGRCFGRATHTVVLRQNPAVIAGRRLRLGVRILSILSVSDLDPQGRFIECLAEEER